MARLAIAAVLLCSLSAYVTLALVDSDTARDIGAGYAAAVGSVALFLNLATRWGNR